MDDPTLTAAQLDLQARARAFVMDVLQPLELELERGGGRLPAEARAAVRDAAIAAGLVGGSLPIEVGGQGWSAIEQVLVHEQFGQATGGSWSFIPGAYNALLQNLGSATAEEIAAALDAREPAEPEEGLTPEVMARLRRRMVEGS